MKKIFIVIMSVLFITVTVCHAGFLDNILNDLGFSSGKGPDENTVISGLKEALSVGAENAVKEVSQIDGYLANEAIKILMPEKIQMVAALGAAASAARFMLVIKLSTCF